ncbi:MAG: class I SAM-dependent methyltransferase [Parasphingorhabdus sp.]
MRSFSNQGYEEEAPALVEHYERIRFEDAHRHVLEFFPKNPAEIVDIGSGTGRDAAFLAAQGHHVVAVEPTNALRNAAMALHPSSHIEWIDDGLPNLGKIAKREAEFDLALMAAVWMHLDSEERNNAMPIVASLLKTGGVLIMNLRHGPVPKGRRMFEISDKEMLELAEEYQLHPVHQHNGESILKRNQDAGVTWSHFVFRKTEL